MLIKKTYRETRRLLSQYGNAIAFESRGRASAVLPNVYKILRARFKYGVGPVYYALYRFSQVPESEWGNYVTDDPRFKEFLKKLNPDKFRTIADNKLLFHRHCVRNGLPTIPMLCLVTDDADLATHGAQRVRDATQLRTALQAAPGEMFVKTMAGTYGEGAFVLRREGDLFSFAGRTGSPDALFRYLIENLGDEQGWILQPRARSHESLRGVVSPNALATVRAVTQMRGDRAELLIADLKITVGDSVTDNFSKGKSGNLLAGIDVASGRLGAAWGSIRKDWPVMTPFANHPETGCRIEGYELPFWRDLVDVALRAQESVPQLRSLGWDIAATTDGIMLVEANSTYDVSILQVAHQRGLKRELQRALARSD
ncbi:sugar-transfer associated ATP-grasp domain-containing protein [Aromatoleum sp.]|uniref:sugar-transfer associated ATP-grasp domain-containing protein n=1 Tax=Aromatoleum sp. TaxID=2307007 RepID=UPI002FC58B49